MAMGQMLKVSRPRRDCVFARSYSFLTMCTELFLQCEFDASEGFLRGINGERFFAGRKSLRGRKSRFRECVVRVRTQRESSSGGRLVLERLARGCCSGSASWRTLVCS